jgi:hypothetical protein
MTKIKLAQKLKTDESSNATTSTKTKKPKDSPALGDIKAPLSSRDDLVKHLQERFPGLTEEEITLMGG